MSAPVAAAKTKIFGLELGADGKKIAILGALVVGALSLYFYNSRDETSTETRGSAALRPSVVPQTSVIARRPVARVMRQTLKSNDRGTLRLRPINGAQGDVDPTLRLDLLSRLETVNLAGSGRNLFGLSAAPAAALPGAVKPMRGPIIPVGPIPNSVTTNMPPPIPPIPLKFYGFVQPKGTPARNRGFFLDGENILVGFEGEVLKQQYRIVQLTATGAVMEDVKIKNRQTLPLVAEAPPSGS